MRGGKTLGIPNRGKISHSQEAMSASLVTRANRLLLYVTTTRVVRFSSTDIWKASQSVCGVLKMDTGLIIIILPICSMILEA